MSLLLFVSHFKKSASMPIQTKSTRAPGNPSVEQKKQTTEDIQIQDGSDHRGSPTVIGWELKHGEGSLDIHGDGLMWHDIQIQSLCPYISGIYVRSPDVIKNLQDWGYSLMGLSVVSKQVYYENHSSSDGFQYDCCGRLVWATLEMHRFFILSTHKVGESPSLLGHGLVSDILRASSWLNSWSLERCFFLILSFSPCIPHDQPIPPMASETPALIDWPQYSWTQSWFITSWEWQNLQQSSPDIPLEPGLGWLSKKRFSIILKDPQIIYTCLIW